MKPSNGYGEPPKTRQWACMKCGKLLGVVANGKVHIQIGRFQYTAAGSAITIVQAVCPKCSRLNEVVVEPMTDPVSPTIHIG